jgi:hypothetical protein
MLPPVNRQHHDGVGRHPEVDGVRKAAENCPSGFVVDAGEGGGVGDDARDEAVQLLAELPTEADSARLVPSRNSSASSSACGLKTTGSANSA